MTETKNNERTIELQCRHCGSLINGKIKATFSINQDILVEESTGRTWLIDECYEVIYCNNCKKIMVRSYIWHEWEDDETVEVEYKEIYPVDLKVPLGLPENISKAYIAAKKVKNIDANAYAVLIGRVIEMVCLDRNAKGKSLFQKLKDLSLKGEIPEKLYDVANSLKDLRNIGAHAELGELTHNEVPIVENLTKALLEYVYSAPKLVQQAEEILIRLKNKT